MAVMINTSFIYLQCISIYKDVLAPLSTHTVSLELHGITAEMCNLLDFNSIFLSLFFSPMRTVYPALPSIDPKTAYLSLLPQHNRFISHFSQKCTIGKT